MSVHNNDTATGSNRRAHKEARTEALVTVDCQTVLFSHSSKLSPSFPLRRVTIAILQISIANAKMLRLLTLVCLTGNALGGYVIRVKASWMYYYCEWGYCRERKRSSLHHTKLTCSLRDEPKGHLHQIQSQDRHELYDRHQPGRTAHR